MSIQVLAVGGAVIDYLGLVKNYPTPETKIKATTCQVAMGGNCLNATIVLGRLDVRSSIATKIGKDYLGNQLLDCFAKEGVDTTPIIQKENTTSPFSYIIVDTSTKTRTVVFNACEELLSGEWKQNILDGVKLLVLDGKQTVAAVEIADLAFNKGIPSLLDAEDPLISEPRFEEVFLLSDYVKCSETFAVNFTHIDEPLRAIEQLLRIRKGGKEKKFVITTLGAKGSILLKRVDGRHTAHIAVTNFEELKEKIQLIKPTSLPVQAYFLYEPKDFLCSPTIIIYSTAYPIDPSTIKDTTGAGDVFLGSVCYSLLKNHTEEKMLSLASFIAAMKCRDLGITGIPYLKDVPKELL